jgi:hypothetical protein
MGRDLASKDKGIRDLVMSGSFVRPRSFLAWNTIQNGFDEEMKQEKPE